MHCLRVLYGISNRLLMKQVWLTLILSSLLLCNGFAGSSTEWLDPKDDQLLFNPPDSKPREDRLGPRRETPAYVTDYEFPAGVLVNIEGENTTGRGFVAKMKEKLFVVTNIHVIATNRHNRYTTTEGKELNVLQEIFLSTDRDLAIIPLADHDSFFEIHQNIEIKLSIDDWVIVPGGGSATKLTGKIKGIGPDKVEVDAKFSLSNSGGPIIDPQTGLVIAIATTIIAPDENRINKDSPYMKLRRFGYRIANNYQWDEPLRQDELYGQREILDEFRLRTVAIKDVITTLATKGNIPPDMKSHPSLDYVIRRFNDKYRYENGRSAGNKEALQKLISDLLAELERDISTTERELKYGFFFKKLQDEKLMRNQLGEFLEKLETLGR